MYIMEIKHSYSLVSRLVEVGSIIFAKIFSHGSDLNQNAAQYKEFLGVL